MLYFDTSFVVPLFFLESTSLAIESFFGDRQGDELTISQWTRIEFSSALALAVRSNRVDAKSAVKAETEFDAVVAETFVVLPAGAADFELGRKYLRRYDAGLRAGDALHLAIARNHGATAIYTLDRSLLRAGKLLELPVKSGIRLP